MPPKKSRSNSTKANKEPSKTLAFSSVQIQTEDIESDTALLSYQQQIERLQQEIAQYKLQISELTSENEILKSQNNNVMVNDPVKMGLVDRKNLKFKNHKIASPRSASKLTKGCSCKGNCSNKICGCVKKGITCREFCRCNDAQCRNQEPDKENIEQAVLSQDGQKALEKFGRLTLNQEHLHASEKKAKRGMFSPFADHGKMENADKSMEIRRRLFTQDSDDVVDIDSADSKDSHEEKKSVPQVQNPSQTPIAKRTRKFRYPEQNLEVRPENDSEESQQPEAKEVARKKNIEALENPSILVTNIEENDDVFLPKTNKVVHSPIPTRRKSKSISPEQVELENKINIVEHTRSKNTQSIQQNELEEIDKLSPNINDNVHSSSFESNVSESTLGTSADTLDVSLNPMVPKRQLPRSPVNATGNVIAPVGNKRFSPPKKELAVVEVDWEKHTAELVMCKICKRKFFPHRIIKHEASCKGI